MPRNLGKKYWRSNLDDILNVDKVFSNSHINCYLDMKKNTSKVVCSYIYNSYELSNILNIKNEDDFFLEPGIGFIYGKNIASKVLSLYIKSKYNYIYMDNSYFSKFYDAKISRYRLSVNQIHPGFIDFNSEKEYTSEIEKMQPWKERFDENLHILICPPTGNILKLFGVGDSWLYHTIKTIREKTQRKIIIRFKNYDYVDQDKYDFLNRISNKFGNILFDKDITDANLLDLFSDCYAVITPASGVGVIAITKGIPVFSSHIGPLSNVSLNDLSMINSPIYPERKEWLVNILNHEFTLDEIYNGEWLVRLKKMYPQNLKRINDDKINIF